VNILRRPTSAATATLVLGAALALLSAHGQARLNRAETAEPLDAMCQRVATRVANRMQIYEYGLRGARGALVAAEPINRTRFHIYNETRDIAHEFPGARGFGVIRRVAVAEEKAFTAAAQNDEWPDFAIRQLEARDGERYVVRYIEPVAKNEAIVGLDVASEPSWREAADAAVNTGAATLTSPIPPGRIADASFSTFLLLLPVFRPGTAVGTATERASAAVGWTFAPLAIDELLAGLEGLTADGRYTLALRDLGMAGTRPFFESRGRDQIDERLTGHATLGVFGRTWDVEVRGTPRFVHDLNQRDPARVGMTGAALAVLAAVLAYFLASGAGRAGRARAEKARRAAIMDGSSDAVIGETLDGVVTDWNRAAEQLFGYSIAVAVGQPAARLVLPEGRQGEDEAIRKAIARGDWVAPFDTTRLRSDGSLIDVSVTASPIYLSDGRCAGLSKTVRDISAARRAKAELARLNAKLEEDVAVRTRALDEALRDLRAVLDAVPTMIGYWERDLTNRVANRAYTGTYGVDPQLLRGKHLRAVIGDDVFARVQPHAEAALRGETETFEISFPSRVGPGLQHRLVHFVPDVLDGEVRGFYSLGHDVTELIEGRRRLADAQRDNEALLQTLHQHAIVSVADRAGRITEVSDTFCQISGYAREELLGQTHRIVNSGVQERPFWIDMWRTIAGGQPWRHEVCNRAKDGSFYWVDSIISPFLGADGRIEKYISIRTDITVRKRAEAALLATSNLLKSVLSAASEIAIIATDVEGTISLFNRGAERLLGYGAEEVVGRSSPAPFHAEEEIRARSGELTGESGTAVTGFRVFTHNPERSGPEAREWTYVRKDGRRVPVLLTVSAMRDEGGRLFGFLGVAADVSRQKEHEQSLREAVHKAKQANRAKSQFLANMSHEIRTPLNAVIGISYLLERSPLDADQAALLGKIKLAGKGLLAIVNDVLDLSKIEAAELKLEHAPFHLGTVLEDLADLTTVQSEAKGVVFVSDAPADLPASLVGDSIRLSQILTNLVTNAIKFTERGSVRLCVQRVAMDGDVVRLRFSVEDTGVGITPDSLDRLFSPFVQADSSTTRRFGGTGLGLSIVKQLAGLMGGQAGASSTLGVGSVFWVELPFPVSAISVRALPCASPMSPQQRKLPGVRVLVADDSPINLEVARRVLELEGARVTLVANGQEAVDCLVREPKSFDVVLMDIQMPVLDGYDATRRIRVGLGLAALPIIALTAGTLSSEHEEAITAGANDFVGKPFDPRTLVACIRRNVSVDWDAVAREPAAEPASLAMRSWPEVRGIDSRDVCGRLGGDLVLFRSLLGQLVHDSGDLKYDGNEGTAGLDRLARRLHSVRGAAASLGAKSIAHIAGDGEAACRARRADPAAEAALQLVEALRQLGEDAASLLREQDAGSVDENETEGSALQPADLESLLTLLLESNLGALDRFMTLAPQLRRRLGKESYAVLREQIDSLNFGDAAKALATLQVGLPN